MRESAERSLRTLDDMLEGCQIIGFDWRYLYVNKAVVTHSHQTKDSLLGRTMMEVYPGIENSEMFAALRRCMEERRYHQMENEFTYPDGTKEWFKLSIQPVPEGIFILSIDISERKRAEMALREKERQLSLIYDTVGDIIFNLKVEGEGNYFFTSINRRFLTTTGLQAKQIIGKRVQEVIPEPSLSLVLEKYAEAIRSRKLVRWEETTAYPTGRVVGDVSVDPVFDEAGDCIALVGSVHDITERKQAEESLRESEGKYRFMFANNPQPMWIYDLETLAFLEVNNAAVEHYGYAREEFLSMTLKDIRPREDIPALLQDVELTRKTLNPAGEWRHLKKNGELINVEITSHSITFNGRPARHVLVHDITERKHAEEALRVSEDKFRYVFDNSVLGKSITQPGGEINVNKAFCDLLGYSAEELKSRNWKELTYADDIGSTQKMLDMLLSGKRDSARFEKRYIHKNGSLIWTDVSTTLRRDEAGKPLYFMTAVLDITERKRAEDEIRHLNEELEERVRQRTAELSDLYNNAPCGYHSLDAEGVVRMMNDTELRWLGYAREEVLAKRHISDLLTPDSIEIFRRAFPAFKERGTLSNLELTMRRKDGSSLPVLVSATAIHDADGRFVMSRSTLIDYSEQLHSREAVVAFQEKLIAANKELEAFSYSVSHDLRAPLRAIEGFSRIVLEEYAPKLDDEARRLLGVITGNTRKMAQLIDDLLAFSRLNRQQMAYAAVDLAALADSIFAELKTAKKGRKIEFKVTDLPAAFGDISMLRQVLQNLLANAVKFTRNQPRARIEFGGRAAIGEAIYWVKDNGAGFNMEYVHKLFGVFQRLHGSDEFEGTGVGLAIVQRIVLRHGGRVWAESGKKGGATFYFALPGATASATGVLEEKAGKNQGGA